MKIFNKKLEEVRAHFQDGDTHLGFRKMVDCVLDTQALPMYQKCIDITSWKEEAERTNQELMDRIFPFLNELSHQEVPVSKQRELLVDAHQLRKRYGAGRFELGAVSLQIHAGEVWGLVGENGNGKTTLLRILAKDLSFDGGDLSFPFSATVQSPYELRTKLTYIPQRTPRWYGSLKSNLKFAASHYGLHGAENELTVLMMIIRFGLWSFRHHNWDELSSGYKMRFELARTFLRRPKLLLLDEPLANLDVLAQQLILEDLRHLSQSISNPLGIILSSQQLFEVEKVSDHVLFLKQGKPTHLHAENESSRPQTVVELEIHASREDLSRALTPLEVEQLQYNGGVYVLTIAGENRMNELLTALVAQRIRIQYVRDISHSTRRLFTN